MTDRDARLRQLAREFMNDPQGLEDKIEGYLHRAAEIGVLVRAEEPQPDRGADDVHLRGGGIGGSTGGPEMTRTEKAIQEVAYRVERIELIDSAREAIQEKFPGGAVVTSNIRQRCEFLDADGNVLDVAGLVITTQYWDEPVEDGDRL